MPGLNSRPLDLQSDSHLFPDMLPTVQRGPVHVISENETRMGDISSEEDSCSNGIDSDAEIDDLGNPIPSTSAVSFKNLMDSAKKQSPQTSKLDKLD